MWRWIYDITPAQPTLPACYIHSIKAAKPGETTGIRQIWGLIPAVDMPLLSELQFPQLRTGHNCSMDLKRLSGKRHEMMLSSQYTVRVVICACRVTRGPIRTRTKCWSLRENKGARDWFPEGTIQDSGSFGKNQREMLMVGIVAAKSPCP